MISKCCEQLDMKNVAIHDNVLPMVPLEKIISAFPKLCQINYDSPENFASTVITSNTVNELLKFHRFRMLNHFILFGASANFDIETFYREFILKNKKTICCLRFDEKIPDEYKNRLESIVAKIITTENRGYKPPCISYAGMNQDYRDQMLDFFG